ncbi:MAG TPA: PEP/pyruvate-binding domain-containing protein, partial [Rectinemataceae bacterium]|nr:PEP/pyruvate-binding domain-containing protein [Rectinemataceae bacterium]
MLFDDLVRSYDRGRNERNSFHDLMKRRVKEVLFVGTVYESFVMESDGVFIEQSYGELFKLNLNSVPRLSSARDASEAEALAAGRRFDAVIVMAGTDFQPAIGAAKALRKALPGLPLVLLVANNAVLATIEEAGCDLSDVDRVFVWNGYSKLFIGIIKYIEDMLNAAADVATGLVRIILLVEDSVRYYSRFLPLMYRVILKQTQALIEEEKGDEVYKLLRSKTRPKVLLASDWESAVDILERHRAELLVVITDLDFPRESRLEGEAGLSFLSMAKELRPDLPFIVQSRDPGLRGRIESLGAAFVDKAAPSLEHEIGHFLSDNLGFGPFRFVSADGATVAVARNMDEFMSRIGSVPPEVLFRHAEANHFSTWLAARGELRLARILKRYGRKNFSSDEEMRAFLVEILAEARRERERGSVPAFDEAHFRDDESFTRLGTGSVGGKGRGLVFAKSLIDHLELAGHIEGIEVKLPRTAFVGIDEFERFLEINGLMAFAYFEASPDEVIERFLRSPLDPELVARLDRFVRATDRPLAVRSSGLFEDMLMVPFSGIYETLLIPNCHEDVSVRLAQLCDAIRLIYASLFSAKAKAYFEVARYQREEERMAIVLQEVVGKRRGRWYYPHLSGTAQSYNYYPVSYLKPEDGLCLTALGLGSWVVDGGASHRFCPRYPKIDIIPPERMRENSQRMFRAIDMERASPDLRSGEDAAIAELDVEAAEGDPKFRFLASTWDGANDRLVPGTSIPGLRFIDLANVLKHEALPLARLVDLVLEIGSRSMGSPVEIEYALNLDEDSGTPAFYILQLKPLIRSDRGGEIDLSKVDLSSAFIRSTKSMGNGRNDTIRDILWIDPKSFDRQATMEIAGEIEALDRLVAAEGRRYLLIGFGRWGTRDPWLGIPVAYSQIAHASVIVEADLPDFRVESSLGSHFFHNVTSMNIGYLTVPWAGAEDIDWDWLRSRPVAERRAHCLWTRLDEPLDVLMDGKDSRAV